MKKKLHAFKVGDSVVVKPGTKDPDTGGDLSGWQGRITELENYEGEETVTIAWDSITLKSMPFSTIEQAVEEGLDWSVMVLDLNEVGPAQARDTELDAETAQAEIEKHTHWIGPDEEDKRIRKVLEGVDPDDEMALLETWQEYLEKKLSFPFETEVYEWQDRGSLRAGDRLIVKSIVDVDDHYGIIISAKKGGQRYEFPLCDLQVTDKNSPNYQPVKDYAIWFANR